jgi:Molybdopterin-binding domain of aldehyde dehydrogenase/Aldehyde oxidase and xanthine dehydrogenase, a/b hammerhead domain
MAAEPARFALARETVRHVGEPVAAVVAATLAQAVDAAERLEVDYAPLSAVTDARAAQAEAAPQLHACAEGNVCFRWARGDEAAVRAALRSAAHVVAIDLVNNRLVGAAIEPRAVIGAVDPQSEKLTLYSSTQAPAPHSPAGDRAARHSRERAACGVARRGRRKRRSSPGPLAGCAVSRAGSQAAPKALLPTIRLAITSRMRSSRSMPTAVSSRCTFRPRCKQRRSRQSAAAPH